MTVQRRVFFVTSLVLTVIGAPCLQSQTTLMSGLKLVDRSSGKNYEWQVNTSATANMGFVFPSSAGTAGQVIQISSVTGTNGNLGWTTPVAAASGSSARLATDTADATAWSTGPQIAVTTGKKYRVVGEFMIKRGTALTDADDFQIRLANPDASTYVACAIECLDCPSGTTGVPQYLEDTGSNSDFAVIDPAGATKKGGQVYHYRIEGIFKPGATGNVRLTFNKNGGAPTTYMMANSYWALIEIN